MRLQDRSALEKTRPSLPYALVLAAAMTPLLGEPASAQLRVGPVIRVDEAPGATPSNEFSRSTSFADPLVSLGGYNDYRPPSQVGCWFALTEDGGETWTEVLVRPPTPFQSFSEGDPMACHDDVTGELWAGGIAFSGNGGIFAARRDPLTGNFEPTRMIQTAGNVDKGWMAAGPAPSDPSQRRVYCAYNLGVARSSDGGDTWQGPVSIGPGVGFLPRVAPDGTVHVAYYDFGLRHFLRSSTDGGVTWSNPVVIADRMDSWPIQSNPRIPGEFRTPALSGLAIDPRDSAKLYAVFPDTTAFVAGEADVDVYFTRSVDAGATWSTPVVLNGDAPFVGDQWFPWIEADEEGRLHVTFLDTRDVDQSDTSSSPRINAYYALSEDEGATWVEARLTPTSWNAQDDGFGGGFLGDYLGIGVAGGRALPSHLVTTPQSAADAAVNVVLIGPGQEYCRGIRCPCGNDDSRRGCGNRGFDGDPSTGADLVASGSPSIAADDLALTVRGVAPDAFGVLFVGTGRAETPRGDSKLCLGGTLRRFPVFQADVFGEAEVGPGGIVAVASGLAGGLTPGETLYFQAFYRDFGGPCGAGFSLTNGVSVTWAP